VDSACLTGTPRRRGHPPRRIEIIVELATPQILPMFRTMFGEEIWAFLPLTVFLFRPPSWISSRTWRA
jgi:hypothetical protein